MPPSQATEAKAILKVCQRVHRRLQAILKDAYAMEGRLGSPRSKLLRMHVHESARAVNLIMCDVMKSLPPGERHAIRPKKPKPQNGG